MQEADEMNLHPEHTLQRLEKALEMYARRDRDMAREESDRDLGFAVAWGEIELSNLQNRMGDDPDQQALHRKLTIAVDLAKNALHPTRVTR
jgi:hypothetical protein